MTKTTELDLLSVGDSCIDLYMAVEGKNVSEIGGPDKPQICFLHGSKIPVRSLKTNIAGNAVNVAVGASLLGLKTAIYSEMGNDEYAERIERELSAMGIYTALLEKNEGSQTGIHPIIMYGEERTIFSHHEIRHYKVGAWPKVKWIYYTSISPGFEDFQSQLVEYLKKNPYVGVAFNPGTYHLQAGLNALKNIISVSHVLFLNKDEAVTFVGEADTKTLHLRLRELGPKLTIITEGEKGASGFDGEEFTKVNAYKPNKPIVDRTGAGDSFAAGAISALFYNKPLKEVLTWGVINSASVLTEVGAIHGLKNKLEMEEIAVKLI